MFYQQYWAHAVEVDFVINNLHLNEFAVYFHVIVMKENNISMNYRSCFIQVLWFPGRCVARNSLSM